jgi:DHA1 family multidrug resistance protein-like MFS transporter
MIVPGWTANSHVNYMASIVGIGIYAGTVSTERSWLRGYEKLTDMIWQVYIVVLGIFSYIPMSYPPYAASLFASNDFCRSAMAFGAIQYSRPMYINLGIGRGSSVLAGLSVLGIVSC